MFQWDLLQIRIVSHKLFPSSYGSGHETAAVLLPSFAINTYQNQVTGQPQFHDLTHINVFPSVWVTFIFYWCCITSAYTIVPCKWSGFKYCLGACRRQAITLTNADALSGGPMEMRNSNQNTKIIFIKCVCKCSLQNGVRFITTSACN